MVDTFPTILVVGTVLGFLAGLGIGGGSLLILWLTMILGIPQETARSINLLFFLPAAIIVSAHRIKHGSVHVRSILPGIIAGCVCAGLFTLLGTVLDPQLLKKPFGLLLLFTGLRELFYRPRKAK